MGNSGKRIEVVDALRGFAIVAIMLVHNIEHFDLYFTPTNLPAWMAQLDTAIWDTIFFLFGGKAYAIFALLFGLTFFIQSNNQEKKGKDFRGRFAWRMLLLLGFGIINSAFYQGDILTIYAVIGLFIIPFAKLSTTVVFASAILFMAQPIEIVKLVVSLFNPDRVLSDPLSWAFFGKSGEFQTNGTLLELWKSNLTNGKFAVIFWSWENGRVFQTLSLFLLGMLAGRTYLFADNEKNKKIWKRIFLISAICFIPLYYIKSNLEGWGLQQAILRPLQTIETSWNNAAFTFILVSGFVLLFQYKFFYKWLRLLMPIGKMSLSNYILQSIVGSTIYYGFGFGLYKYTGSLYCIIIGVILAVLQCIFSWWWMKNHKQGPLESIWHKLTWINSSNDAPKSEEKTIKE